MGDLNQFSLKKTAKCIYAGLLLFPGISYAQDFPVPPVPVVNEQTSPILHTPIDIPIRKIESLEHRMMGGVDIALDYRLNPANVALLKDSFSFRVLGVELTSTDPIQLYEIYNDSMNLIDSSKLKKENETKYYREIIDTIKPYENIDVQARSRIDLLQFNIGISDLGILMFGTYAEGDTKATTDFRGYENPEQIIDAIEGGTFDVNTIIDSFEVELINPNSDLGEPTGIPLNLNGVDVTNLDSPAILILMQNNPKLANLSEEEIRAMVQNRNSIPGTLPSLDPLDYLQADLGRSRDLVKLVARNDAGGYLGIGKSFQLFSIDLNDSDSKKDEEGKEAKKEIKNWTAYLSAGIMGRGYYRWATQYRIHIPRFIRKNNVENILAIKELEIIEGPGYSLDAYLTLALNDPILNSKIALELKDIINETRYNNNQTIREDIKINLGLAIHPFHWADYDGLRLGLDIENLESNRPKLQAGISIKIGGEDFYIMPKAGYIIDELNLFGDYEDSFTAGVEISLNALKIRAIYEQNLDSKTKMFGAGLSIDF